MAIITAGVTASWGGTVFGTVVELRTTLGGGLAQNRGGSASLSACVSSSEGGPTQATTYVRLNTPWAVDGGTIDVLCLTTANISFAQWGQKRVLAMGGTAFAAGKTTGPTQSVLFTTKAICQTLQAGAKVNDVWRFQGTFKIVKETN